MHAERPTDGERQPTSLEALRPTIRRMVHEAIEERAKAEGVTPAQLVARLKATTRQDGQR